MRTVLSFARYPVHPGQLAGFEAWLVDLLDTVRAREGVLWADAARASDDDPSWIVLIEWRSADGLDAWEGSESWTSLAQAVDGFLREDPTWRRFTSSRNGPTDTDPPPTA